MNYIIDIILIAVIVFFSAVAYKKGFFSTVLQMLGSLISLFVSIKLSDFLSKLIYDSFIESAVIKAISQKLSSAADSTVDTLTNSIPEFAVNAAKAIGIDIESILKSNAANSDLTVVAENISNSIIEPIVLLIVKIILMLIIFALLSILVRFFVKLLKKLNKLPILGKFNKGLGLIAGVVHGILIVTAICFILGGIVRISGGKFLMFTQDMLNNTYIFSFIDKFNPFF